MRVSVTSVMLVSILFTTSVMLGMSSSGALTMSELLCSSATAMTRELRLPRLALRAGLLWIAAAAAATEAAKAAEASAPRRRAVRRWWTCRSARRAA